MPIVSDSTASVLNAASNTKQPQSTLTSSSISTNSQSSNSYVSNSASSTTSSNSASSERASSQYSSFNSNQQSADYRIIKLQPDQANQQQGNFSKKKHI